MKSADIIEGAVAGHSNIFLLGCFDKRITFYSQQVRAISLVHALHDLGYLNNGPNIAVIGAGAAGLTAAAAAALAANGRVVLFESSADLLPLQSGAARRELDPHIYDWPQLNSDDAVANLPILDWESGPARRVREDVVQEFEDISARMQGRIDRRTRHRVTQVRARGNTYEVVFDRLDHTQAGPPEEGVSDRFDMVFLAIGFGLEPAEEIEGIPNASYWSAAGMPGAEFAARPRPRFFVSGNGDGGLIDLVASADRDFSHAGMIQLITRHPGITEIGKLLMRIDDRAQKALIEGRTFDIFSAYETEILEPIAENGLLGEVTRRLRPGVRLTLQTRAQEVFTLHTSVLNRLAAFAAIKACERSENSSFVHIACENVTRDPAYVHRPGQPVFLLDCDGTKVEADEVIVRRGPKRAEVRQPFVDILGAYEETHSAWIRRHGASMAIPELSKEARAFFEDRSREMDIPLSRRLHRQAVVHMPVVFQLQRDGNMVRWSGSLESANIFEPWDSGRSYEVVLADSPSDLGAVSRAVLRMALHANQITIHAEPSQWRELVQQNSTQSPHATGISMPKLVRGNPGGAAQNPVTLPADQFGRQLQQILDTWVLVRLDRHLTEFLQSGSDPGQAIDLVIAPDLRGLMRNVWDDWRRAFEADGALLNHFLRLMLCAPDDEPNREAAQVLVGPKKLASIIRGTAVSLAIASCWQSTNPKGERPGNLGRGLNDQTVWSGHGCAAERINGTATPLCAGNFMWETNFVILTVQGAIDISRQAEATFSQTEGAQPTFTESKGSGPILMWISNRFSVAVELGNDALTRLLQTEEAEHFARLASAIEVREEVQ